MSEQSSSPGSSEIIQEVFKQSILIKALKRGQKNALENVEQWC